MLAREVRILFGKEWRQLLRSRGALLSALLLPLLLLVIIPGVQLLGLSTALLIMLAVPGPVLTSLALAALFAGGSVVATFVALKVITLERLLR